MSLRPLIGVTLVTPRPGKTREEVIDAGARYLQAVQEAGGKAETFLAPDPADDREAAAQQGAAFQPEAASRPEAVFHSPRAEECPHSRRR